MSLDDDIRDAPDDDGPRLVWADAVGGERGELVVLQCDLARGDLPPDAVAARKRRQRELLAAHGVAWSGLAGLARRCTFRRGFVEAAEVDVDVWLHDADEVFRAAPALTALTATGITGVVDDTHAHRGIGAFAVHDTLTVLARLFAHPRYAEFRGLELMNAGALVAREFEVERPIGFEGVGNEALELMVRCNGFAALRAFGIRGSSVGSRGIRALVEADALASIERLWIHEQCGTEAACALLTPGLSRLTALDLHGTFKLGQIVPRIPAGVVELRLMNVYDRELDMLAASAVAPRLERLALDGRLVGNTSTFARFPRLRSLDLRDCRLGDSGAPETRRAAFASLVSRPMPPLRELRCPFRSEPAEIRAIVDAFGAQLELLDVPGKADIEAIADELAPRVAGELRVGTLGSNALLRVGGRTGEPYWDHATIVATA